MAPNPITCGLRCAKLATVTALVAMSGCSQFFKLTPEGMPEAPAKVSGTRPATSPKASAADTIAERPAGKTADNTTGEKPQPTRGRNASTPPQTRRTEPVPTPMTIAMPEPAPMASDSAGVHRLMQLAVVWQTVSLHHPFVASRGIGWDSALVRAVPAVRAASDQAQFAAALSALLDVLGDPLTAVERVERGETRAADADAVVAAVRAEVRADVRAELTGDSVLVVRLPPMARYDSSDAALLTASLGPNLARVVLDLRGAAPAAPAARARVEAFLDATGLASMLTSVSLAAPSERVRRIGGDDDAWLRRAGVVVTGRSSITRRVAVIADTRSAIPPALLALLSAGRAPLVVESATPSAAVDGGIVSSVLIGLAPGLAVRVRTGELQHADGTVGLLADTVVSPAAGAAADTAPALRAALHIVRSGRAPRARRAPPNEVPMATLPIAMDNQNYPSMGARVLGGFRLWSAMRMRHVNRDLYDDDLDVVFERVLPRLEAARNEQQYAAAIGDLASSLDDAEGTLGGPSFDTWLGTSVAPFRARLVEGRAIMTDVVRDAETGALGLTIGTEIVAVDGFPLVAWLGEHRRIGAASNEWTRTREQLRIMTLGPEGTMLVRLRDAANRERIVNVPRHASNVAMLPHVQRPDATAARRLDSNIGYVDLERLDERGMDSVLTSMRDARALVMDLRSSGTAGTGALADGIAMTLLRRVATQPQFVSARQVRRWFSAPCLSSTLREAATQCPDERETRTERSTVDTSGHYRGRVVVLIDERTQGAMERLAIALEGAATVTFIGSASAGAASPAVRLELPGALTVGIPVVEARRVDGTQIQRVGITPGVEVRPTVRGIRNRQDEVIDRARQWLVQLLDPPVRRKR